MKTVKQVSELTGISIRTLHYYDEIGLLKPSQVSPAGYRLYDENALHALQQILFFKELHFPLKDIRAIMSDSGYDQTKAFIAQKKLIEAKRDRLNRLLTLLDQLIKGEASMSFEAFDMSAYTRALEDFMINHREDIRQSGGNLDEFEQILATLKSDDPQKTELAKMAVKQFGSIEKYTEAMKQNMENFPQLMTQMQSKKEEAARYIDQSHEWMKQLTADLNRDVTDEQVQQIVRALVHAGEDYTEDIEMGEGYWQMIADNYLSSPLTIKITDEKYGDGAAAFIGKALKAYLHLT